MASTALQHAMDLTRASLVQGHAQPTTLLRTPCHLDLGWQRLAVIEHDATPQTLKVVVRHTPLKTHQVGPGDAVTRVQEAVRQASVVGQEEHAFGVHIETSDWKETHWLPFEQVEDGGTALIVLARGDIAARLVQQNIAQRGVLTERLAIHHDHIDGGIDRGPQPRDLFAVDDDTPRDDQGVGLTPGGHPGLRNNFV
jgi:hypothetical protein